MVAGDQHVVGPRRDGGRSGVGRAAVGAGLGRVVEALPRGDQDRVAVAVVLRLGLLQDCRDYSHLQRPEGFTSFRLYITYYTCNTSFSASDVQVDVHLFARSQLSQ